MTELFTVGPDRMTPGTKMPVQRIPDPDDMQALIHYLSRATAAHTLDTSPENHP